MAQVVVAVLQASPVDLVLQQCVLVAVVTSCDPELPAQLPLVEVAWPLVGIEAVAVGAGD